MQPRQIHSIEWLRGFASLAVCICHIFTTLHFFSAEDHFFQKYLEPLLYQGRLGVPIFFVISGFILPYSMWKSQYTTALFFRFMAKRMIRLQPAYLLSILLSLVVYGIVSRIIPEKPFVFDATNLLLHTAYLNVFFDKEWINPVFWTLAIEFQFYIFIGLLFHALISRNRVAVLWLITVLCAGVSLKYPREDLLFFYIDLFVLGILCFQRLTSQLSAGAFYSQALLILSLILYIHGKAYLLAALGTAVVIVRPVVLRNQVFYFLGNISYSLYVIHWTLGVELLRTLIVFFFPSCTQLTKIGLGIALTGICIAAAWVFYRLIEKPSLEWSRRISLRPKA